MKLTAAQIAELAEYLESAQLERREVVKITDRYPDIGMEDAYAIQNQIKQRKLARGEQIVGLKVGLTSYAKMKQMGVETPIFGFMTDTCVIQDASEIPMATLIHPKVEPEIAFFTKAAIRGPGCNIATVLAATDFVMPAIEVIDSRYRDFKFDLVSVVADNTSATRFIVGGKATPVTNLDLAALGVVLEKNGRIEMVAPAPQWLVIRRRPWRCWPIIWQPAVKKFRRARSSCPAASLKPSRCKPVTAFHCRYNISAALPPASSEPGSPPSRRKKKAPLIISGAFRFSKRD